MAIRYLGERQRTVEMLAALYAAWYSCITGIQINWYGANPLGWSGMTEDEQSVFAWVLLIAALMHGIGIEINGRWKWSPMLRAAALALHLLAISVLLLKAGLYTSASTNYSFIVGMLVFGLGNAVDDAAKAWRSYGRPTPYPVG
jgi:hypothetical protein